MAVIRPFRALRPAPERAAAVSSVPYDVVSADEARQLAASNPLSFLRVTRSEIDLPPATDPYSDIVYATAKENLATLRDQAPLVVDREPSLYVYRLRMGEHEQTGLAACFSLDEYDRDVIKKHERTRRDKEDDRTRHIVELRAQTGIVFLTYPSREEVERLMRAVTAGTPLYDFAAADDVRHTVWRVAPKESAALMAAFATIPALYIADGHHRAASAARARSELRQRGELVRPTRSSRSRFPIRRRRSCPTTASSRISPARRRTRFSTPCASVCRFAMARRRHAAKARSRCIWPDAGIRSTLSASAPADASSASSLDVALLQHHVLEPLLKIGDVRTDKRIDFVGGARGTTAARARRRRGRAAVAFSMHPVTIDDLMAIADEGGIMPPKSTWFEPKLRDGLLVHLI